MKIIISPAKIMQRDLDTFPVQSKPLFLSKTKQLEQFLKSRTKQQLKELWRASDKVVAQAQQQLKEMDLEERLTPAILAFGGLQYQYMAPDLFTQEAFTYIQNNLRILSGFYGILRPFDGICPYRLEMNTAMTGFKDYSLYHFWGDSLAKELFKDDSLVLNLASKEYSRAIKPYVNDGKRMITIDFQEQKRGKWRSAATHAKMARGEMVRYIAERQIKNPALVQDFHDFGFKFIPEVSDNNHYVFRTKFSFKTKA